MNQPQMTESQMIAGSGRTEDIRRLGMGDEYEPSGRGRANYDNGGGSQMNGATGPYHPKTDEAAAWRGWGTALKPAWEPIVLARKPLDGTVAENVLQHGTGALNIDGCRVATADDLNGGAYCETGGRSESPSLHAGSGMNVPGRTAGREFSQPAGRWPANVIHDGSPEVLEAFAAYGERKSGSAVKGTEPSSVTNGIYGKFAGRTAYMPHVDTGSAARFFYTAKADADDRFGSKHPTVKPIDLMSYLCRLVTPPGGLVLDPFAGSGTTGVACLREGFRCILIEREAEYVADINARLAFHAGEGGHSAAVKGRRTDQRKARGEDTPLFGGGAA